MKDFRVHYKITEQQYHIDFSIGEVINYDAISVEGPLDACNGKQFYKAMFEENNDDNGGYSSKSRGYCKNFFENAHSRIFKQCKNYATNQNKIPLRIIAIKVSAEFNPFYLYDREGKQILNSGTTPRIGSHFPIYLLPNENSAPEIRRLKFVDKETIDITAWSLIKKLHQQIKRVDVSNITIEELDGKNL